MNRIFISYKRTDKKKVFSYKTKNRTYNKRKMLA